MTSIKEQTDSVKQKKTATIASTQVHLQVAEIRDNVVVLKNGGLRAIFKTSSINFNLKSEAEQNAIIYSYQNFLNTLDFPIQIEIRSRKLEIDSYIEYMKNLGEKQTNPLLQRQTFEYAEYIQKLIEYANIMEKEFFVIVPYDPYRAEKMNIFQKFLHWLNPKDSINEIRRRHQEFEQLRKGLNQRINVVKSSLENCGLKVEQLTTSQLIEFFYKIYNPETSRQEKIKNLKDIDINLDENSEKK